MIHVIGLIGVFIRNICFLIKAIQSRRESFIDDIDYVNQLMMIYKFCEYMFLILLLRQLTSMFVRNLSIFIFRKPEKDPKPFSKKNKKGKTRKKNKENEEQQEEEEDKQ